MDASDSPAKALSGRTRLIERLQLPWLLSPLLYPALYWSRALLPEPIRAFLSFLCVVVIPGWLLHLLILPRARIGLAARITRAYVLGLAVASLLGLVAWFFGGDVGLGPIDAKDLRAAPFLGRLDAVIWGEAILLLIGALLLAWRTVRRRERRLRRDGAEGRAVAGNAALPARPGTTAYAVQQEAHSAEAASGEGEEPPTLDPDLGAESAPAPEPEPVSPFERMRREAYRLGDQHKADHPVAPRWATLLVLGVLVLAGSALGFYTGGDFGYGRDSLAHTACIREMVETDRILPRTSFHIDGDGGAVDSRMGFFHVALAVVCRLVDLPAPRLWMLLPGILAPFGLIIFHTLARRLLRTEGTALFATFLALLLFGEAQGGLLTRFAYGNQMGMVLAWATLAVSLQYALSDRRRALLWLVAISSFAASATHAFAPVQILFSLGVFLVALLIFRGPRNRTLRHVGLVLIAVVAGAAPILLWRYIFAYDPVNPVHTHRHGLLFLSEKLFVILPDHWARQLTGVGFGGILLSLFLWKRAREDDRVLYLAALSIAPLLIIANPLIVPLLEPLLGYLLARLVVTVPFLMVLAYVARWMGESLLELNSLRRIVTSLLFYAFMVWLLFPRLEAFARSYSPEALDALQERSALLWEKPLAELDATIGEPAVILSDPFTSYAIPAMTRHYSVAVLNQHASPSDSLTLARLAACRDVLSPYLGTGEKARICRRFGVDYVLVNGLVRGRMHGFFADATRHLAELQSAALDSDPDLFAKVWDLEERDCGLYRVRRENLDILAGIVTGEERSLVSRTTEEVAREILLRRLPAAAVPVLSDTVAGITLAAAALDTTLLARGERTIATIYWRRVGPAPEFPVITYVRLDNEPPRGPLWMSGISKLHRSLLQARRGAAFRLQLSRAPLGGTFGPEHWPRDRFVADRISIRIPEAAATGEYFVRVKWMEQSLLPNLPIEHFLSDHDAYEGLPVGALEVY